MMQFFRRQFGAGDKLPKQPCVPKKKRLTLLRLQHSVALAHDMQTSQVPAYRPPAAERGRIF